MWCPMAEQRPVAAQRQLNLVSNGEGGDCDGEAKVLSSIAVAMHNIIKALKLFKTFSYKFSCLLHSLVHT